MSKKKTENQSQKRKKTLSTRSGITLIALLAVLILLVSVVTLSYSWFEPQTRKGTGMEYIADAAVRSENCRIVSTSKGTINNGEITYGNPVTGSQTIESTTKIQYFKTVIENLDDAATNVSLFISSLPAPGSGYYGFGVAVPSNSYRKISSQQTDFYVIRNAYISGKNDEGDHELTIEWFVRPEGNEVSVDVDQLYIMYN